MAHNATLKIDTEYGEYTVIECDYEFIKQINDKGIPCEQSRCGLIHLTMVAPDNNQTFLHDWIQKDNEYKDGEIKFSVVNAGKPAIKTLNFKRAYCIRLREHFNAYNGDIQMLISITISADEISFGNGKVTFKN